MSTETRGRRKVRTGVVVSDKRQKTVTVELSRRYAHGFYGKQITRTKRVAAHDEQGAKSGDLVRIMETRPLSRTKRWRVVEVIDGRLEHLTPRARQSHPPAPRRACPGATATATNPRKTKRATDLPPVKLPTCLL